MKENRIMKTKITFIIVVLATIILLANANSARAATWIRKADMPTPRWAHAVAAVNNKIYAIGGIDTEPSRLNGKPLAAVEEYDPATDTWTLKDDMPAEIVEAKAYGYASPPVVDGKIYLIGGGITGTARTDIYDPAADAWSRGADMPTPRNNTATAVWNDKIYVFGGIRSFSSAQGLKNTEVYDPKTDTWSQAAPIPRGVWGHSAHVVDGKVHLIGGGSSGNVEQVHQVYDPLTDTWTNATPIPMAVLRHFGAGVLRGRIYVVGGWLNGNNMPYSDTWVYDPLLDTWTASTPLPERRVPSMAVVNGRGYVIGGSPTGHNIQATATVYELTLDYDLTGDYIIDGQDMSILVDHWHTDNARYDINGDGIIDVQDLILLSEHLFEEILPLELIAYWKLDEVEGDIAYNSIGDNHGTLSGNPIWQPDSGQVAGTLQFDGLDDYISTGIVLNPKFTEFSVFAWIKGGSPGQAILSQKNSFGGVSATWLGIDPLNGCLMTELVSPPVGRFIAEPLESNHIITDDIWHHVGFVWDGSHRTLYVDGMEVAKDANPLTSLNNSDGGLCIGTNKNLDAGTYFSGLIDDVRIYNEVLTAEEIAALAQ